MRHIERHRTQRVGWLRAAVLGANDGIISTASLILGVAAAGSGANTVLLSGLAAMVAGSMSMAAGEYVSVSSQADTESADLERERRELSADPAHEHEEMTAIYVQRGLDAGLAAAVATQLMAHDALGSHARDELGITSIVAARPLQAALASACSFAIGGALPLGVVLMSPAAAITWLVPVSSLVFLAMLGALAARTGGASVIKAAARVTFWGAVAMGITAGVGAAWHVAV
jgi:VIT1/CCC1 family predicted Fe2+/Mn2+ transporter